MTWLFWASIGASLLCFYMAFRSAKEKAVLVKRLEEESPNHLIFVGDGLMPLWVVAGLMLLVYAFDYLRMA